MGQGWGWGVDRVGVGSVWGLGRDGMSVGVVMVMGCVGDGGVGRGVGWEVGGGVGLWDGWRWLWGERCGGVGVVLVVLVGSGGNRLVWGWVRDGGVVGSVYQGLGCCLW